MNRRLFIATTSAVAIPFLSGCVGGDDSDSGSNGDNSSGTENTQRDAPEKTGTTSASDRTTVSIASNTQPSSGSTSQAPTFQGTVITERDQADISIENTTNKAQTITLTVTPLPDNLTPRPIPEAPYEPRDLSGQSPLFSETFTLSSNGVKSYPGRVRPVGSYQITIKVSNGPTAAFDWHRGTEVLRIDTKKSSVEFSTVPYATTAVAE